MTDLNLAMIGNCGFGALVDRKARIVWSCYPFFDGDPIFCNLVNGGDEGQPKNRETGFWGIELLDFERSEQKYIPNTAVLETVLYDKHGGAVQVTDLAPRFAHYERFFHPSVITRSIKPLQGSPRVRVLMRPRYNYGANEFQTVYGSNHISYIGKDIAIRLNTDASISYIKEEKPFLLDRRYTMILGPDEPLKDSIAKTGRRYKESTEHYWKEFARNLALPFEWQEALIRCALTLKMCTFEETGAVLAAVTTSIPEAPGSQRNWDYRYCWLRDSFFVIQALNRLGTTKTMEDYLRFVMNIIANTVDHALQPMYGIDMEENLEERVAEHLSGYRGMGPVRVGNAAYLQKQNDVFGAVILAATQAFFDKRLTRPGTIEDFHRLETLGEKAVAVFDKPDAGIWELRGSERVHTFSAVMCWVAADRLARISRVLDLPEREAYWRDHAVRMHKVIDEKAWCAEKNSYVESFTTKEVDACLLLLAELGFVKARDPKFIGTVEAVEKELLKDGLLYRYVQEDDFGKPEVAFTVCTFWYIDALASIGRVEEAREIFERMLTHRNHVGLLSEDLHFETGELWGNFPQTYSLVGLVNSAMKLSKTWEEALS